LGKTSLAKRWLDQHEQSPIEVTIPPLAPKNSGQEVIEEIKASLQAAGFGAGGHGFGAAAQVLAEKSSKCIVPLFIDEVPMTDEALAQIPNSLSMLLDVVKRKAVNDVRFLVCSINGPAENAITEKMKEQFALISLQPWAPDDIARLFDLILSELKLVLSENARDDVIRLSAGSPRFVKVFFRRLKYDEESTADDDAVQEALREAAAVTKGAL
jgi:hypothetical protein